MLGGWGAALLLTLGLAALAALFFSPSCAPMMAIPSAELRALRAELAAVRAAPSLMIVAVMPLHCAGERGLSQALAATLNRIEYARLHGYRLAASTGLEHPRVRGPWNKLAVLQRLMHEHRDIEWFLFTDTDAIIEHPAAPVPLNRYGPDVDLVMLLNRNFFTKKKPDPSRDMNSGVMLLRNTAWARGLLASLLRLSVDYDDEEGCETASCARMKHFLNGSFNYWVHDQNGLAFVLRHMNNASRAKVFIPDSNFNAQDMWSHGRPRDNSSFRIAHFNGCGLCAKDGNSPFFSHDLCFDAWEAKWERWLELLRGVEQQRLRRGGHPGEVPSLLALPVGEAKEAGAGKAGRKNAAWDS